MAPLVRIMREVRVRYSGAQMMRSDFKELLEICERITLMGSIWRDEEEGFLRQIFEIKMLEGQVIDSINDISFMAVEDVLSVREEKGHVIHTAVVRNYHGLGLIGQAIETAVVVPGSCVGRSEAVVIIRGSPEGCKQMVEGIRLWREPNSISVVDSTPDDMDYFTKDLTEARITAFAAAWKMGYYQNPRGSSPTDIASSIGISRVTLTGHLRSIENHLAPLMVKRLNL